MPIDVHAWMLPHLLCFDLHAGPGLVGPQAPDGAAFQSARTTMRLPMHWLLHLEADYNEHHLCLCKPFKTFPGTCRPSVRK